MYVVRVDSLYEFAQVENPSPSPPKTYILAAPQSYNEVPGHGAETALAAFRHCPSAR